MPRVNILKQVKVGGRWRLRSIPRTAQGRYDWKALPEGRYLIEWYDQGKRRRQTAGATVAQALEAARRRKHLLEGRALGFARHSTPEEEEAERTPLHVAVRRYLDRVEGLKKPNTLRKYRSVLNRFVEFFSDQGKTATSGITPDNVNDFMAFLKLRRRLDNNTVLHNMIIVA